MKKNSALKKMPQIIKGAGGYTYKYTSPKEAYDLRFPDSKFPGAKPAVYVDSILEVKGPNSKTFTKIGKKTPEYKSIMKEIGDKIEYKDAPDKLPFIPGVDTSPPSEPYIFAKMKRRSDGSVAKLKNESFMKRMKRLNKASSPVMKNGGGEKFEGIVPPKVKGTTTGVTGLDTFKSILDRIKKIGKGGYGPGGLSPYPGTISDDLAEKIKRAPKSISKSDIQKLLEKIDKETRYKR